VNTLRGDRAPIGLGGALRAARTDRGLSLTELQARTKIRTRYLAALEEERFTDLPPYPFARGFVHAVATELGLDPRPLIDRLAAAMGATEQAQAARPRRLDAAIEPAVKPSRARRLVIWTAALAVAAGGAAAVNFWMQMRQLSRPAALRPVPAEAPQAVPSPGLPVEPAGTAPSSVQAALPPEASGSGLTVDLEASGRSWVRIVADGEQVFVGFIEFGQQRTWEGRESLVVRLGTAGAVAVTVNGRALGPIGAPGQVVERTFRKDETP
jgi:cytoskeleton protein RodZ